MSHPAPEFSDQFAAETIREILESRLTPSWREYVQKTFRRVVAPDELASVQEVVERLYADGYLDAELAIEVLRNVDRFALCPPPTFIQLRSEQSNARSAADPTSRRGMVGDSDVRSVTERPRT